MQEKDFKKGKDTLKVNIYSAKEANLSDLLFEILLIKAQKLIPEKKE